MPSDKPSHPDRTKRVETQAQPEAGPSDWFTEKKVKDPTVDHRCCGSKDHRSNDEHYRRGPSL
jgi:hypothetical protein